MKNLAPIGISTYSRINHLKQTIEALQKNTLAKESELYIFSDAPREGDEEIVAKVRRYIRTVDGFKKVHIVEREVNGRVSNNRGGMKQLLDQYGKMIFLEDDIVTAPGFLCFMNNALEFYKDNENIISISGYAPPIHNYNEKSSIDMYLLPRFCAWGFGMTLENFKKYQRPINKNEYKAIKNKTKVLSVGGIDVLNMIQKEVNGELDAGDVRIMYQQAIHNKYTLYPIKSLVQNIGHDGTGVHCGLTNKFEHKKLWSKTDNFKFIKNIQPDQRIIKANYKFRNNGLKGRIIAFTQDIGIYSILKKIKEKL